MTVPRTTVASQATLKSTLQSANRTVQMLFVKSLLHHAVQHAALSMGPRVHAGGPDTSL